IFAMSLDLLLGYTGLASLGHAAYFGIAAYVVAIMTTQHQASFWACLGAALLAACAAAAVFGLVAIRATGVYFLMITLALGMVTWGLALRYDVWLHKYVAFILSGAFAGLAGAMWAYYDGFVSPVEIHLVTSVETLLMVALGGPGTLVGPVLGAGVIVLFKNLLSIYTKRWLLILGLVYIGVIVLAPKGIVAAVRGARR